MSQETDYKIISRIPSIEFGLGSIKWAKLSQNIKKKPCLKLISLLKYVTGLSPGHFVDSLMD